MTTLEENFHPPENVREDAEISSLIQALFAPEGATQKTVLSRQQVIKVAVSKAFASEYHINILSELATSLMELKISEKGRGRVDLVKALQSRARRMDDEQIAAVRQKKQLLGTG